VGHPLTSAAQQQLHCVNIKFTVIITDLWNEVHCKWDELKKWGKNIVVRTKLGIVHQLVSIWIHKTESATGTIVITKQIMIYDRYDLVWVTASHISQHITNLAGTHNVQNKSWFAYKIMDSSSRLNYSYTTHMWRVLHLFSFHVTTHFTLKNTENNQKEKHPKWK